ncbi:hypothetical protein RIEPE_0190 [Candidatus Riesia pediculicola USDA]|uniref:Uncharacterized protein n=1 Tax=Riesia pediculicola (strain USDA) TaxID=515618 RepID=D4G7Z8_RIEPU|nr:hypothetical protein RIEPE_0190 [Candidatus Riesia pediculicola USDA]
MNLNKLDFINNCIVQKRGQVFCSKKRGKNLFSITIYKNERISEL